MYTNRWEKKTKSKTKKKNKENLVKSCDKRKIHHALKSMLSTRNNSPSHLSLRNIF